MGTISEVQRFNESGSQETRRLWIRKAGSEEISGLFLISCVPDSFCLDPFPGLVVS
jgi:hypothetical protein